MAERSEFDGWIQALDAYWTLPNGTLYQLRQGELNVAGIDELISFLRGIAIADDALIPKRFASLLWMLPTFMGWQVERVIEGGGSADVLRDRTQLVYNEVERILGIP
jgi:hypothetical protein